MQPNKIEATREEIAKYFSEHNALDEEVEVEFSPENTHHVKVQRYRMPKPDVNWRVSKVEVFGPQKQPIASLLLDDGSFVHRWLSIKNTPYLFLAESMCGGNSLLNLKTGEFFSHWDGEDGFICTGYEASPGQGMVASMGCYWACPYVIRIFDITRLESLPWPVLQDIDLQDDEVDYRWADDFSLELLKEQDGVPQVSRRIALERLSP